MNNNLKQAFSEVFGKGKEENYDDAINQVVNKHLESVDNIDDPLFIEKTFAEFEEIEPTGKTMSEEDRALIDKKAEEFKRNLTLNTKSHQQVEKQDDIVNNKNKDKSLQTKNKEQVEEKVVQDDTYNHDEYRVYDFKSEFSKKLVNEQNNDNNFETTQDDIKDNKVVEIEEVKDNYIKPIQVNNKKQVSNYVPSYSLKSVPTTFIDENTKLQGSINSESNLNISGEIEGDITCNNDVAISGKIVGNIMCENFIGDKCVIEGNINAKKSLIIKNGSTINGDVSAEIIEVSGKINGKILSASDLSIYENSAVYGDITSKSISVEKNSIIQGNVNIKSE